MYPYQLSKLLADEHIHAMIVTAERHRKRADARVVPAAQPASSWRVFDGVAHLLALLHVHTPAHGASPRTSTSSAGPMGCAA